MPEHSEKKVYSVEIVEQAIKGAHFPCSKQDLIQQYGEKEIEFTKGHKQKLRDVLQGLPYNTFSSVSDLKHAFYEKESKE